MICNRSRGRLNQNSWSRGFSTTVTEDILNLPILSSASVAITCCNFVPITNTTCTTWSLTLAVYTGHHSIAMATLVHAKQQQLMGHFCMVIFITYNGKPQTTQGTQSSKLIRTDGEWPDIGTTFTRLT